MEEGEGLGEEGEGLRGEGKGLGEEPERVKELDKVFT